jgi:Rrf2 family nitric oxide-sensitive transcriptional repressor
VISKDADYGVRLCVDLALQGKGIRARIAKRQGIPMGSMPRITRSLRSAGIISATPGRGGGLALGRATEAISLLDVVRATGGRVVLNCCSLGPSTCKRTKICPAYPHWQRLQDRLDEDLAAVTIADIAAGDRSKASAPRRAALATT